MTRKTLSKVVRDRLRKVRKGARRSFSTASVDREGNLRIPLGLMLETIGYVPLNRSIELLRILRKPCPAYVPTAADETCEIDSLAAFPSSYGRLAGMLGQSGKVPPSGEMEFLQAIAQRPRFRGTIPPSDYLFLTAITSILAPPRVIEIGTLTGFSAVIIAAALERQSEVKGSRWLDTIDIRTQCLIDESRPTGFEIAESYPRLSPVIRLHAPFDSTLVRNLARRDEIELAFIDAHHGHPMPLLDLLRLAPYMKREGWVVLHDIRLGTLGAKATPADPTRNSMALFGAEWLFNYWPFRKITGGNIGAIQMPADNKELIQFSLGLMSIPFELEGESRTRRELYKSLAELIA